GAISARAHRLGPASTVRAMELLGQALVDMREAPDPRVLLEVALVRLSHPDADTSVDALVQRIERLERAVAAGGGGDRGGGGSGATAPSGQVRTAPAVGAPRQPTPPPAAPTTEAAPAEAAPAVAPVRSSPSKAAS